MVNTKFNDLEIAEMQFNLSRRVLEAAKKEESCLERGLGAEIAALLQLHRNTVCCYFRLLGKRKGVSIKPNCDKIFKRYMWAYAIAMLERERKRNAIEGQYIGVRQ